MLRSDWERGEVGIVLCAFPKLLTEGGGNWPLFRQGMGGEEGNRGHDLLPQTAPWFYRWETQG